MISANNPKNPRVVRTRRKRMIRKTGKMAVMAGMAMLVLATWHVAAAKPAKRKKAGKPALPPAAAAAIRKAFPKATIDEVERETASIVLYEVELKQGRKEIEVQVSRGGQIVEIGRRVAKVDLPKAVARTLAKLAGDARIREIEREEIHAVIKFVKLKKPLVVYEAEFVRNGKEIEVRIAPDGTLLAREVEDDDDDGNDD